MATKGVLTPRILERIVAQADGVPLFIEELTKAVEEARTTAGSDLPDAASRPLMAVPATLQASLMARLDRLGSTKEVAQVGAVIGRTFDFELLATASRWNEIELDFALRRLVETGLVFAHGEPPQSSYVFKHALVQDTAYDSLLRGPRKELHRKVAEALEARFDVAETPRSRPVGALIGPASVSTQFANHSDKANERAVEEAGQPEIAVTEAASHLRDDPATAGASLVGGRRAAPRGTMVADWRAADVGQIGSGRSAGADRTRPGPAQSLPEDEWRWQTEVELQLVAANALMVTHGHAAPLAGVALARAVKLCEHLPSAKQRLDAQLGLSSHLSLSGELPEALGLAEEMLADCAKPRSAALRGFARVAYAHFLFGRFDDSIDDLQQFVSLWHSGQPVEGLGLAHDPGSVTCIATGHTA